MSKLKVFLFCVILIILNIVLSDIKFFEHIPYASLSLSLGVVACIAMGAFAAVFAAVGGYLFSIVLSGQSIGIWGILTIIAAICIFMMFFKFIYTKHKVSAIVLLCIFNAALAVLPFYLELGNILFYRMLTVYIVISLLYSVVGFLGGVVLLKRGFKK